MQHGLCMLEVLAVEAAAMASLSAVEPPPGHLLAKPLVMTIAIIFVAARADSHERQRKLKTIKIYRIATGFIGVFVGG